MTMSLTGATGASPTGSALRGNVIPKGYQLGQLQQFTPEQMNLFQNLFSNVQPGSSLSRLAQGDQGAFEQMEAPAMRQFQGLLGDVSSRFSGMGMGSRRGSGFTNTVNQATSDFAQDLASRRMSLQRQALMDLMGISESLLGQRPYEQFFTEKKKPFWKELLLGLTPGVGQGAGTLGGMWGAKKLGLLS